MRSPATSNVGGTVPEVNGKPFPMPFNRTVGA